ncbi:histidine kinase [Saxibacter everestensis]|uniref:histidine kinase n=1 Tax=Saxibacter everestensis TaxID=2909229 RepID=A0ABY8QV36_9MICO|nr:histidine kinase [Brevibacteriaceae bacterium ZFBP1038]
MNSRREPEWRRPMPARRGIVRDSLGAVLLMVGTAVNLVMYLVAGFYDKPAPMWISIIWAVLISAPLALRRRFPATVAVVVAVVFILGQILMVPEAAFSQICLFIALYTLGAWGRDRRRATIVRLAIIVAMFTWFFVNLSRTLNNPLSTPDLSREGAFSPLAAVMVMQLLTNLLYFSAAYFFGNSGYRSAMRQAELEAKTLELERERVHSATQAVALERVRIARELHDVVAHHVSVMGIQAGAARRVLATDAGKASTALSNIESSARDAVAELRRLLGALRESSRPGPVDSDGRGEGAEVTGGTVMGGQAAPDSSSVATDGKVLTGGKAALRIEPDARNADSHTYEVDAAHAGNRTARVERPASESASTQGVGQLPALVEQARLAGLPTDLHFEGEARELPGTISFSIYRIVQEALTNSRKHAGENATARIRLEYSSSAVEVQVSDDGGTRSLAPVRAGTAIPGVGLGQIGMRERALLSGGEVEFGPKFHGGYLVRAAFPLTIDDGDSR